MAEFGETKLFAKTYDVTGSKSDCAELAHWLLEDGELKLYSYDCYNAKW